MSKELIAKGHNCIRVAREAYRLISLRRRADGEIAARLESLRVDVNELLRTAQDLRATLATEESSLHSELNALQEEQRQFQLQIQTLNQNKSKHETDLASQEAVLRDHNSKLQQAQRELQDAQNALDHAIKKAKKKKKKKKRLGGYFGAMAGFAIAGPAGALLGAAAGAAAGGSIGGDGRVQKAKLNLDRQRSEHTSTQQAVTATKQSLSAVKGQISIYEGKIAENQRQSNEKHNQISSIKKSIAFQKKSVFFWELYIQAIQHADDRTVRLRRIVDKAAEGENLRILRANGTVIVATSFVEAWEAITANGQIQD